MQQPDTNAEEHAMNGHFRALFDEIPISFRGKHAGYIEATATVNWTDCGAPPTIDWSVDNEDIIGPAVARDPAAVHLLAALRSYESDINFKRIIRDQIEDEIRLARHPEYVIRAA